MQPADFIANESALLDARDYHAWLALFTDDARYWAPYRWDSPEPINTVNLLYDDMGRLKDRVERLFGGDLHAQDPPSHTTRLIGHVVDAPDQAYAPPGAFDAIVAAPFRLAEYRKDRVTDYAGRYTYWLRREGDSWQIVVKKVQILGIESPVDNMTFPF